MIDVTDNSNTISFISTQLFPEDNNTNTQNQNVPTSNNSPLSIKNNIRNNLSSQNTSETGSSNFSLFCNNCHCKNVFINENIYDLDLQSVQRNSLDTKFSKKIFVFFEENNNSDIDLCKNFRFTISSKKFT